MLVLLLEVSNMALISPKLTNSGEQTADSLVVLVTNNLVRAEHTAANTLNNTDLAGTLVVELTEREGEGAELLDNLGKSGSRTRSLEAVGGRGAAVESGAVAQALDLTGAQTDTNLDTPSLADLGETITSDAFARGHDDLLLALNLVSLELPAGRILDQVAVVALDNLFEQLGDLALTVGLHGTCLGDLIFRARGKDARRQHGSEKKLVGVVGSKDEVSLAALEFAIGVGLGRGNNDRVADNGAEAVNLSTKLDLDTLGGLEFDNGLIGIALQGSVWSDKGAGRDGGGVGDTLDNLLSLVDLCNLLLKQLVTLFANVNNLGALSAPSLNTGQSAVVHCVRHAMYVPVTASRTFWEI
jgi:hypothetical protein